MFGAQKGADSASQALLDMALKHLNQLVIEKYGVDYGSLPGAGQPVVLALD